MAPPANSTRIVAAVSHSVDAQSRGTDRANKRLRRLRVPQAACHDPDKTCHHRYYAKYNQVFHFYFILFAGDEVGTCASIWTSRSLQPGHGCPQRSQLQAATASISPIGALARTAFCNKCVGRLASSCNRRIVFIGTPFLAVGYGRRTSSTRPRLAFAVHKLRGQQRPCTRHH